MCYFEKKVRKKYQFRIFFDFKVINIEYSFKIFIRIPIFGLRRFRKKCMKSGNFFKIQFFFFMIHPDFSVYVEVYIIYFNDIIWFITYIIENNFIIKDNIIISKYVNPLKKI